MTRGASHSAVEGANKRSVAHPSGDKISFQVSRIQICWYSPRTRLKEQRGQRETTYFLGMAKPEMRLVNIIGVLYLINDRYEAFRLASEGPTNDVASRKE